MIKRIITAIFILGAIIFVTPQTTTSLASSSHRIHTLSCGAVYPTSYYESTSFGGANVSGQFTAGCGSVTYYSGPTSGWSGSAVAFQGPSYYYNGTSIVFWFNVKYSNGHCLYPRAVGYSDGSGSGFDGDSQQGVCSF